MIFKKGLLFLLFIVLVVGGILYYLNTNKTPTNKQIPKEPTDQLVKMMDPKNKNIYEKNNEITQTAIKERNYLLCKQSQGYFEVDIPISKIYAVDKCLATFAISLENAQICDLINNSELKSSCIFKIAETSNSLSLEICEKVKSNSWYFAKCVANVAHRTGDITICDKYFEKYTGDWGGCTAGLQ